MKQLMRCLVMAICLSPVAATAVEYAIDSSSYLRFQQATAPGFDKKFQVPATQYLTIDASKLGLDGLSLHFYGWGNAAMGSMIGDQDRYDGNLTYFYLSYRLPTANAQVKAGRFFVMDGMEFNQIDGVSFRTDLPAGFTLSAYGGAPSKLDYQPDNTGSLIGGGRISKRFAGIMEIGASGLYENGLSTIATNGTYPPANPASLTSSHRFRQLVGGDVWLSPAKMLTIAGHTNYNITTSGIAENSYLVKFTPAQMVTLSGDYSDQNPSAYFASTNLPSLFNPSTTDKFRKFGGMVIITPDKNLELSADFHHYTRNQQLIPTTTPGVFYRDYGTSNRYGVDVRISFAENKGRTGFSFHRMDGPNQSLCYNELRGYTMYDAHTYVLSFDAIGQFYKQSINNTRTAYELLASAGYRFTPSLLLSGDVSYGQNPDYDNEVKGLVKLVYNFTSDSKGAHK